MIIDLDTKKLKENDLLIIKLNKGGVAIATPITKDNLIKAEKERIFNLEKRVSLLEKEKEEYEKYIESKINRFLVAVKGDETNA